MAINTYSHVKLYSRYSSFGYFIGSVIIKCSYKYNIFSLSSKFHYKLNIIVKFSNFTFNR